MQVYTYAVFIMQVYTYAVCLSCECTPTQCVYRVSAHARSASHVYGCTVVHISGVSIMQMHLYNMHSFSLIFWMRTYAGCQSQECTHKHCVYRVNARKATSQWREFPRSSDDCCFFRGMMRWIDGSHQAPSHLHGRLLYNIYRTWHAYFVAIEKVHRPQTVRAGLWHVVMPTYNASYIQANHPRNRMLENVSYNHCIYEFLMSPWPSELNDWCRGFDSWLGVSNIIIIITNSWSEQVCPV